MIVFEDDGAAALAPVTLARPAFAISCGGNRLVDLLKALGEPIHARVRPHLRDLQPDLDEPAAAGAVALTMWVNARVVPSSAAIRRLKELKERGRAGVVKQGDTIVAALVSADASQNGSEALTPAAVEGLENLPDDGLQLLEHPHDVVRQHLAIFAGNLEHRLAQGSYTEIADGVFAAPGATLGQHVVTDTRGGPIVLDTGASIGPFCFLRGPVYAGPGAKVIEHASLKDGVSLGHTTKVGGEVEASIIEPYTNKQHHGFLGHSYLGSWINLGAGTCNSDLKNTYGKVNMIYRDRRVETGMQFLGCIVGDYAKSAINTSIFTGKTIGACSMLYGFVTTNVPSFVNYARSFGQVTEAPVDMLIAAQARMFLRRGVQQRACDIQLLRDLFELTRPERELAGNVLPGERLTL